MAEHRSSSKLSWIFTALIAILFAAGMLTAWAESYIPETQHLLKDSVGHISTALLVGSVVSLIEKILLHSAIKEDIKESIGNLIGSPNASLVDDLKETLRSETQVTLPFLKEAWSDAGIRNIHESDQIGQHYKRMIEESSELVMVMNYVGSWLSSNGDSLRKRFRESNRKTEIYTLCAEDNDASVAAVAQRQNIGVSELVAVKLLKSRERIIQWFEEDAPVAIRNEQTLLIREMKNAPTLAMYLGNNEALIAFYRMSGMQGPSPLLRVGPGFLLDFVKREIEEIRKTSKLVHDTVNPQES